MSRILFAWELGGGYGHLGPFRPIAEQLLARGHEITVAAREVERANIVYGSTAIRVVQAPVCLKTYGSLAEPPLNYAEILMRYGYLDAPLLGGLVRAWRGLLELALADVLIADHAPSALIAARGTRVARVVTGSPFTIPPQSSPTPNMRPWVDVPARRLESSDASVLAAINESLPAGSAGVGKLGELFEGAEHLISGVPELDTYGPRAPESYVGLHAGVIGKTVPDWPEGEGPKAFVYVSGEYRHIDAFFAALAASNVRCIAFLRDANAALRQKYDGDRIVFSDGPVDIDRATDDSDFCVCHANFGTVTEVLRRGKPLLMLPMDLEKFLISDLVQKQEMGCYVSPEAANPDFGAAIRRMLETPSFAEAARAFARKHREPPVDTIVERAASRIDALARTRGERG